MSFDTTTEGAFPTAVIVLTVASVGLSGPYLSLSIRNTSFKTDAVLASKMTEALATLCRDLASLLGPVVRADRRDVAGVGELGDIELA
jgi:hypothetical protein